MSRNGPSKILKRTSKITDLDQEGLIHTVQVGEHIVG